MVRQRHDFDVGPVVPQSPLLLAVNSTALPPGKTCGQRWVISPLCNSVTGVGGPPAEGIRDRPLSWRRAPR